MASDRYLFKDLAFDVKRKRPKHFENLSSAARLLKMELFPSFYKLLDDGDIRQTLFLQRFPDIEGFVELAKISKENRAVLSQGCTANDPAYLIEEKLKPEKVNSSLKFEQDPSLELVEREYVYLPVEVSSNSYPSLKYDRKWKYSFVTGGHNPMSNKFSFKVWVVESRDGTQMVGLRNIANGLGHITSFNIGVPKANNNRVPELYQNACISVRELEDYLDGWIPDEVWDEFLNPKTGEKKDRAEETGEKTITSRASSLEIEESSAENEWFPFVYGQRSSGGMTSEAIVVFGNSFYEEHDRVPSDRELWDYMQTCEKYGNYQIKFAWKTDGIFKEIKVNGETALDYDTWKKRVGRKRNKKNSKV